MIHGYAAFEANQELKPFEYDPGELGKHDVELDVRYCGICHSDVSIIENAWGITQFPVVPGHEVVGTVAQVGERVTHLKPGQTVGLGWNSGFCNQCAQCHAGDHNLCAGAEMTIVGRHGGFANKVRAAANSVVPLPEGIDPATAGPLFCGGITVFTPLLEYDIKPTRRAAVIGIGGLGHLALQFLKAWGCEVTAFTSSDAKKEEVLKLGAHDTINSRDAGELEKAAGRFDLILCTVNVKLDWNLYVNTLAPRGRLHFVGATLEPLDLQVFPLIVGQRSVSGSPVGSPRAIAAMLEFARRHGIQPVTEHFKLAQVNDALEKLRAGKVRYRAVLEM